MNQIKLVIWDLDETFWRGTLSEEGIVPVQKNIDLIAELTNRGIINSICSKNEFRQASEKLKELDVWSYFIFPSISWDPKGPRVKQIIEQCQLRAENILFLDDNHLNLEEVKYYNEGVIAEEPEYIFQILGSPALKGKDDRSHSRLGQYKLLEKKAEEKSEYSSNLGFLRDSNIQVEKISDLAPIKDRIEELLNRTNQLNFTKKRLSEADVEALISDGRYNNFAVRVKDRFGDYGVVGFISYDPAEHCLNHFVFSCRILNLGIEQYFYKHLNEPELTIEGEVISSLDEFSEIDWISELDDSDKGDCPIIENGSRSKSKLLFVGSCELGSIFNYLAAYSENIQLHGVKTSDENLPEFSDHLETIIAGNTLPEHIIDEKCKLPFISRKYAMANRVNAYDYDVLIYSVVANYGRNVYSHKKHGFRVAWGEYKKNLTRPEPEKRLMDLFERRNFDADHFLKNFRRDFNHLGYLESERFLELLKELRSSIPETIPILFINGSEINTDVINEPDAADRHKEMNSVLSEFIAGSDSTYLIDVRKLIEGEKEMGTNIRTFHRQVYKRLADEIVRLIDNEAGIELKKNALKEAQILWSHYTFRSLLWLKSLPLLRQPFIMNMYRKIRKEG
ncbi:HAD-IIIC family phosphatase [Rhodohalobacter sp. 8-1]|uniref:HAD-IIIC family phosphatase n=1 Tax=Rhodohalobacter sp. 8-1 TaxID=3131972 RepID=UPI0030ECB8B0